MNFKHVRLRLLSSLRLLARPAKAQAAYLARIGSGDSAEELRLQYQDAIAPTVPFVGRELSEDQAAQLDILTRHLDAMAVRGRAHLWSDQALWRAAEWARVRELAAEALVGLNAWPRRWGKGRRRMIRASDDTARRMKGREGVP